MNFWIATLIGAAALLAAAAGARQLMHAVARKVWFATKPSGTPTPTDCGLEFEEHWIPIADRRLQAWFVRAPARAGVRRAMLLFQGGNDVISELGPLQKYLFDHGISSFAFDFSGNGNSTGRPSAEALAEDGVAAFRKFLELAGEGTRTYAWGFSSGTGRVLAALSRAGLQVDGVVLMGPFSTSRALMRHYLRFIPEALGRILLPEYWDNLQALRRITSPVLLVHSRADEAVPFSHAEALARVDPSRLCLRAVDGLKHNDCWNPLHEAYWQPAFELMEHGG